MSQANQSSSKTNPLSSRSTFTLQLTRSIVSVMFVWQVCGWQMIAVHRCKFPLSSVVPTQWSQPLFLFTAAKLSLLIYFHCVFLTELCALLLMFSSQWIHVVWGMSSLQDIKFDVKKWAYIFESSHIFVRFPPFHVFIEEILNFKCATFSGSWNCFWWCFPCCLCCVGELVGVTCCLEVPDPDNMLHVEIMVTNFLGPCLLTVILKEQM